MFQHFAKSNKTLIIAFLLALFPVFTAKADVLADFEHIIEQNKGKVIYVDFWASWCVPCRRSFPWMNEMQAQYGDKGFTVVSINLDAKQKNADKFLAQYPATFPVVYDTNGQIAKKYQLRGMPSSFIVNQLGEIVSTHVGFTDDKKAQYQQEIQNLLDKK